MTSLTCEPVDTFDGLAGLEWSEGLDGLDGLDGFETNREPPSEFCSVLRVVNLTIQESVFATLSIAVRLGRISASARFGVKISSKADSADEPEQWPGCYTPRTVATRAKAMKGSCP